jgi:1,5-anhydro-D-fructose reductase (1,5-anhydro-D-mannitol-forming)
MLNWAIIGSGDVVERLVQDSLNVKNKSKVKYIYSLDKKKALEISKRFNYGEVVNNYKDIIKDKSINSVYIATPPNFHLLYIKFFSKKIKNIFCEKPLGINSREIKIIKNTIKKNKNNFFIPFYRRFHDRFIYIKKIIDNKKLGKPIFFRYLLSHNINNHPTAPIFKTKQNIPWRFNKSIAGGGNYIDMGPHFLDLVTIFLGDIIKIDTNSSNLKKIYNVEETLTANIKLKNNICGQAIWSSIVNDRIDLFEIFFTKGKMEFSLNFNDLVIIKKDKTINKKKFPLSEPLHKNFILNMIKILSFKKKYVDVKGINLSIKQFDSINK